MSRIPPVPRYQLSAAQQKTHDALVDIAEAGFGSKFTWEDDNDALVGPFPFFMQVPEVGEGLLKLIMLLGKLPLPKDAREVVILTFGAHFKVRSASQQGSCADALNKAGYEVYSHEAVALADGILSKEIVEALKAGKKPPELNEGGSAAYDAAHYLASTPGPMPQELWDRCNAAFGHDGTVALVHYAGFYAYICVVLNACDTPVPNK